MQPPEPTRRGRPAREPLRYAVAELQDLVSYLQHNLAKQASVRDVYKVIEERRAATRDPRLRAYQWHSFSDRWFDAVRRNILPSWELLVRPWALALGGEQELATVEQLYNAIGPAESRGRLAAVNASSAASPPGLQVLTGHAEVDALLSQIVGITASVVQSERPLFVEAIMPRLDEISRSIRSWRDGSVDADSTSYDSIVIRACRNAREVKATSIPEFTSRWVQSYGDRLLSAHAESGAKVTRMFIFDSRAGALDDVAQQVMMTQVLIPATILIYLQGEANISPPPGCSWDFLSIDDGDLISEALFHDGEYRALKLYFGNHDAAADYRAFFERLSLHSTEYGRFMTQHGGPRETAAVLADLARLLAQFGQDPDLAQRLDDLAAAYRQAGPQAARSALAPEAAGLLAAASQLPLRDDAAGSVPSTYQYLLQSVRSAVRTDLERREI